MRLLSVKLLQLCQFNDEEKIPNYAILSHTWGDEEVTFDDMRRDNISHLKGYRKLRQACARAAIDGFEYIWIDTCCIDKSSSAELSEAINSMFRWYELSARCYAYLEDVTWRTSTDDLDKRSNLESSRWFSRGWTLQELISPDEVFFYDNSWEFIGTRTTLGSYIALITSIDTDVLVLSRSPFTTARTSIRSLLAEKSVAQRIFNIHMPLLYGEGTKKAFTRLQTEILRDSTDQSILAWSPEKVSKSWNGALATHPMDFTSCGNLATVPVFERPFEATNRGLMIDIRLVARSNGTYTGVLACHEEDDFFTCIAIPLLRDVSWADVNLGMDRNVFLRNQHLPVTKVSLLELDSAPWRTIYLATRPSVYSPDSAPRHFVLSNEHIKHPTDDWEINALPKNRWNPISRTMQFRDTELGQRRGALAINIKTLSFGIAFGVDADNEGGYYPYVHLFHGPPANITTEVWLDRILSKSAGKIHQRFDEIHFLNRTLRVDINSEYLLGKLVLVIVPQLLNASEQQRVSSLRKLAV
ncbi:hypothetical protein N0V90_012461 [Kalmusia sp. IMI 367209]|nr:hypothetical protein N0V90_012461 [Kalmusia sp. IMI 367209]